MREFTGISASRGVALGKAVLVAPRELTVERRAIKPADVEAEQVRLERTLAVTREEFAALRDEVKKHKTSIRAEILDAYMLILDDEMLTSEALKMIGQEKVSAEYAFKTTLDGMLEVFEAMEDPYFRERAVDFRDVGNRVVLNLLGVAYRIFEDLGEDAVLVAHDLPPSDAAALPRGKVRAIVTEVGSRTSHTAIMAQSMEVPAVVGAEGVIGYVRAGDLLVVDGIDGRVIVNPTDKVAARYRALMRELAEEEKRRARLAELPATTLDGYRIELSANVELLPELEALKRHGCDGVGLYRTEFLFLHRRDLPSEEEQLDAYRKVAEASLPHTSIIRTVDIGGDKFLSFPEVARELNPYLGLRAIRFCLKRRDIFRTQLRAILRATVYGKIKIMFPMISDVEELRAAKEVLADVGEELRKEGRLFEEDVEVGIMVEVPSAVLSADVLAQECDFFSLGTNDLIQYTLAADRGNEKIAYLYEPFHPAVLKLIKATVDAAHRNGIWVGVCGEMVADPKAAVLLLGLSFDEFSASPASVPDIKTAIRAARYVDARRVAERAVRITSGAEIRAYLTEALADMGVPAFPC
ncbi:MAG: phosphoenolpyruvate--protein phosphotransferase [candidate division Zixibacteria bacterium]|nr:phosphoenolpyruvate--protein phosphotransferase [candidate division Zixibacteria bacterium]